MDARAVVTTANATWMPEFPVATPGQICTRADGRWGPHEYSRWPQLYHSNVIHHSCIPQQDAQIDQLDFRALLFWKTLRPEDWAPNLACGVPDLGSVRPLLLMSLHSSAGVVMDRFEKCADGKKETEKNLGQHLCATIRQALARLRILPTWRTHAIALAAHVQRLCLELCGLIVLFEIVQPRVLNVSFVARKALPVRGAFTSNPSTAEGLHRLGIPVWFIQPLTKLVRIVDVISYPTPVSSELSEELSLPRLHNGPGDLAGLVRNPADWPFRMQEEALRTLLDAILPPLPQEPQNPSDAPVSKKARIDSVPSLDYGRPVINAGKLSRRSHRGHRAAPKPVEPHPSCRYQPSNACTIPVLWAEALSAIGTLPPPPSSAAYYWPPPFLFQGPGAKTDRYYHNYVRIRAFCRQRLLDPTIGATALRVAEWRDALWGDYKVHVDEAPSSSSAVPSKDRRQMQQNVRRLFSNTAGLSSYNPAQTSQWGHRVVGLEELKDAATRSQILWEVHEINWRCELLEVDRVMIGSHEWRTLQRWEREARVSDIWSAEGSGLCLTPLWESDLIGESETSTALWFTPPHDNWAAAIPTYRELARVMG